MRSLRAIEVILQPGPVPSVYAFTKQTVLSDSDTRKDLLSEPRHSIPKETNPE